MLDQGHPPSRDDQRDKPRHSASFHLPRTSTDRRNRGWLKLLTRVDPFAPPGLQFEGQLLTPGAPYDPDQIRALLEASSADKSGITASRVANAVILECAGSVRVAAARSRYSFHHLWVLWRLDGDTWREVLRATSDSSEWSYAFAPVAFSLLYGLREGERDMRRTEAARAAIERLTGLLTRELDDLRRDVALDVLAALDGFVAEEIVRRAREISPASVNGEWPRIGAHANSNTGKLKPEGIMPEM